MGLNVWTTSGTMMLFYLAALQAIPTDVYEAAAIDGAGAWRTFWKITFPLLKPGHFFVAVVSVIGALKVFDQAFIVSGGAGGPNYSTLTAVLYLYQTAIQDVDFGYAAAIGVALFVLIFTLTLIQRLLFGKAGGRPDGGRSSSAAAAIAARRSPPRPVAVADPRRRARLRRCSWLVALALLRPLPLERLDVAEDAAGERRGFDLLPDNPSLRALPRGADASSTSPATRRTAPSSR